MFCLEFVHVLLQDLEHAREKKKCSGMLEVFLWLFADTEQEGSQTAGAANQTLGVDSVSTLLRYG